MRFYEHFHDPSGKNKSFSADEKASEGEEGIIARGSKPVAPVVPVGVVKGRRQPGSLKGKLRVGPEFFEPLPMSELSSWE
jgi:antitoxin (DNA-binding transcriptional repressor) of toxin-antitoxin stability system